MKDQDHAKARAHTKPSHPHRQTNLHTRPCTHANALCLPLSLSHTNTHRHTLRPKCACCRDRRGVSSFRMRFALRCKAPMVLLISSDIWCQYRKQTREMGENYNLCLFFPPPFCADLYQRATRFTFFLCGTQTPSFLGHKRELMPLLVIHMSGKRPWYTTFPNGTHPLVLPQYFSVAIFCCLQISQKP